MDASRWRFVVEDPLTGMIVAHDLPINGARLTESLNRPGALSGTVPLADSHATAEILSPGRRAIYALRDGVIQWGGPLWTVKVPEGSDEAHIECEGWLGYWDHRDIWQSRSFTQIEQFDIFKTLIDDAQDETGTSTVGHAHEGQVDLGISVTWDTPSGVLRDRIDQYADHQAKNLGDALRELAAVEDGFDYSMRYTLDAETIGKEIRLHYPGRGRDMRGDASHRFEFEFDTSPTSKTNVIDRGVVNDATEQAWRIRGWGEGMDATRLRSQSVGHDAGAGYLPVDQAPSWSTVAQQSTLNAHVSRQLSLYQSPARIPSVTVDPNMEPRWGSYGLGDVVPLDIRDISPLSSYGGPARIVGWSVDVDSDRPSLTFDPVVT